MPVLSNLTLRWDVPLTIYQIDVKEVRTGVLRIANRNPFSEVTLRGQFVANISPELRAYGAIYREAITTESVPYQFLCFFRLIESMQARRTRLSREASRRGETYTMPVEIYPRTQAEGVGFLNSAFPVKPSQWDQMTLDSILGSRSVG